MKKPSRAIFCQFSAIAFFALLSWHTARSLLNCFCAGLLEGTALGFFPQSGEESGRPSSRILLPASAVLSVPVLWAAVSRFAGVWSASRLIASLSLRLFSAENTGSLILGVFLGALAAPFVLYALFLMLRFLAGGFTTVRYAVLWRGLADGLSLRRAGGFAGKTLLRLFAGALAGTLLLMGAYALPVARMDAHVRDSAPIMDEEWAYPVLSAYFTSQLDNYTDAIILLEAADPADSGLTLLERVMLAPRGKISAVKNPAEELAAHYLEGMPFDSVNEYARYWHGNLVAVKPLLLLLNYGGIRILNGLFQVLLLAWICILLQRRGLGMAVVPTLLAYGMLMPLAMAKSLQFSACFYVLCLGSLTLLLTGERRLRERASVLFLYIGMAAAYFDLTTYPISTFGVPALFFLLLCRGDSEESRLCALVKNGFSWCHGFGGIWVLKWAAASLVTGTDVFADGAAALAKRASYTATENVARVDALSCLRLNYEAFFFTPVTFLAAAFLVWLLWRRAREKAPETGAAEIRMFFPFFLVGLAPVVWYLFAANHSTVHWYFANKACVVSFLAVLFGAVTVLNGDTVPAPVKSPEE